MKRFAARCAMAALVGLFTVASCSRTARTTGAADSATPAVHPGPLILAASEGERRVRRFMPAASPQFILKVDRRNGGSKDLLMGYEEIPPGSAIPPHRHLEADEILFVHGGSGVARVGDREATVGPGGTIFIPRDTRVTLRNTGAEPLAIAFIFSKPGFEDYLRETSVPEGGPVVPLSAAEVTAIRQRHRSNTVFERP